MPAEEKFSAFKSKTVVDLQIGASAPCLLSCDAMQEVRDEAVERAQAGETINLADVEKMIAERAVKVLEDARKDADAPPTFPN